MKDGQEWARDDVSGAVLDPSLVELRQRIGNGKRQEHGGVWHGSPSDGIWTQDHQDQMD